MNILGCYSWILFNKLVYAQHRWAVCVCVSDCLIDCLTDIFVLIHVCCQSASFVSAVETSRPPLLSSASVPGWSPHFWAAQLEQQPGLEPKWRRCFRPRAKQVYCTETLPGGTLISGLGAGEEEEGEGSEERWGRELGKRGGKKKR